MRYIYRLPVTIIAAVVLGFLVAGAGTKITHKCVPADVPTGESVSHCAEADKALMHPNDLRDNKQGSLTQFSKTFLITSLVSFVLFSIFNLTNKRNLKPTSRRLL